MPIYEDETFALLRKWGGKRRDTNNLEQTRDYARLTQAYGTTLEWAKGLKEKRFPQGEVDIRQNPAPRGTFANYNWAKIYPEPNSPRQLAYTVGIDSTDGFVVKIDTVRLKDKNEQRQAYLKIRGDYKKSGIVAIKPFEYNNNTLRDLINWSADEIDLFTPTYDELIKQLNLVDPQNMELVLDAFPKEGMPDEEPGVSNATLKQPINRIYYGPPGTGKTHALLKLLKRDYEQKIDSVRPDEWSKQFIAERIASRKWWEVIAAALYELGKQAKVRDISEHRFIQEKIKINNSDDNLLQNIWSNLNSHTVINSETVKQEKRIYPLIFDKSNESVWHLVDGWGDNCEYIIKLVDELKSGKPQVDLIQRHSFVTFHQSYGYEEFVEGLRPILVESANVSEVAYEIRSGVFKDLCRKARQAPNHRFAMVIDEINRGNISKIFGELITLVEADKRDQLNGSPPGSEVILAYSGEKFSVPVNVDIIGTMNTADRSLALLDTALRRRFEFIPLMPDTRAEKDPDDNDSAPLAGLVVTTEFGVIEIRKMLKRINERIEALYDRDHGIGHAYLTELKTLADGSARFEALTSIFRNRILPLLEEYFFEDWQKIRLVLADNQKNDVTLQFIKESSDHDQDLSSLFGNDHGLDNYATKRRYSIQESAFSRPQAYISIYKPQV